MRVFILALFAVAAATSRLAQQETSLRPGRDYVYDYVSQALTGVSVDNIQYAGLKLKCHVRMQTQDGRQVNAKMEQVDVLKLNREVPHYHPSDLIPDSEWTRVTGNERQRIVNELQKPFSFRMERTKLDNLVTERDDPKWSVNIKRGYLSFLQIDLQDSNPIPPSREELRVQDKLQMPTVQEQQQQRQDKKDQVYHVMEEDICGKCESIYSVQHQSEQDQQQDQQQDQHQQRYQQQQRGGPNDMKVTKVKNFDNCIKRPIWKTGQMESVIFKNEYSIKEVNNWQMEADYHVQGDKQNFLIKFAKQRSKQHFNDLPLEKGKFITYTTQQMTLLDVEETRQEIRVQDKDQKESLIMEVPEPVIRDLRTQRDQQQRDQQQQGRALTQTIEELLDEVMRKTRPVLHVNATIPLGSLLFAMKELPLPELHSLFDKYVTQREITPKGEILLDLLHSCTRPDVVPLIVQMVQQNKISDARGTFMISQINIQADATTILARDLLTVVRNRRELERQGQQTWRACTLALGSVVYKLQLKQDTPSGRQANLDPIIDRIAQEFIQLLQQARSNTDKIVILKALGNAGLPQCTNAIKEKIFSTSESVDVREKAIYALRNLAATAHQQVQNIVLPVYLKESYPLRMRVAAFLVTVETRPNFGIWKLIAKKLNTEQSLQCGSFVYSFMYDLSQFKDQKYANRTEEVTRALKFSRAIRPGFQYSKGYKKNWYTEFYKTGMTASFEYINSRRDSYLPDTFIHRQDYDFVGFPFHGYEFGIQFEGMQTLMKNVIGPKSMLKDFLQGRLSLKDIMEPIQHPSPDMLSHIRSMMDKISITERDMRNFAAMMYFKSNNFELNYMRFDSNSMQQVFQYTMEKMPEMLQKLQRGIQNHYTKTFPWIQASMEVPTAGGLPLSLNISAMQVLDIDYNVRCENMPSLRDLLSQIGQQRTDSRHKSQEKNWRSSQDNELKCNVFVRPSFLFQTDVFVNIRMGDNVKTGITQHMKQYATVPVRGELKYDMQQGKLKTKIHLPEQDREQIVSTIILTKTCYIQKPQQLHERDYVEELVVRFPSTTRLLRQDAVYRLPLVNMDLVVDYEIAVETRKTPLLLPLFARKNITLTVRPTPQTPREIEIESVYLGPEDADRARNLVREMLDIDSSRSDSEDQDDTRRQRQQRHSSQEEDEDSWWWTPSLSWRSRRDSQQQQRRSQDSQDKFDLVRPDQSIPSPRKYKLITVVKSHQERSHQQQKKIAVQLTHVQSDQQDQQKYQENVQIVYTPLDERSSSQEEKKIVIDKVLDLDVIKKYLVDGHTPMTQTKERCAKLQVFYGPKQYTQKKLDAEIQMGRGAPLYLQSSRVPSYRQHQQHSQRSPLEITLDMDCQDLPHPIYKLGKKAKDFSKALPYITDYVTVESEDARNPPNKVKIIAEFRSNETEVELLLMTPQENQLIKNLPIPFLPKRDAVCSLSESKSYNKWACQDEQDYQQSGYEPVKSFIHYISGGKIPGKCHIFREEVHTYDKKTLRLPKTDCETVIAKDCSSRQSPEFMVTTSKKNKDEEKKIVKIYLQQHKIKIEPESGWFESGLEVEVNDRKVHVPEHGEKVTIYKRDQDPSSEKIAEIKKKDGQIEVKCIKSQIKVKSDGNDVSVKVHPSYYGQLCGVCSNYNGEPSDDFEGPEKQAFRDAKQFLLSYIIPDSRCNIEEVRQKLSRHAPLLLSQKDQECRKEQKTVKVERKVGKQRETCFSIRPVPKCQGQCQDLQASLFAKKEKTPIAMKCLPTKDAATVRLLEKFRRGEVLDELRSQKANHHEQLIVPDRCVPKFTQDQLEQQNQQTIQV